MERYIEHPEINIELYAEIHDAFKKSEAAESLKNIYRWSQFRTDESNEEWLDALGPTAQVYSHGWTMMDYGRNFLLWERGRFTSDQEKTFLLGLVVHDWGEAVINGKGIGDIGAYVKTAVDEKKESVIARKVIRSLDLSEETKQILTKAYKDVIEGGDPELHNYFKALEKAEYVLTARDVYLGGKWRRANGRQGIKNEIPLVGRVLVFDLAKLIDEYAKQYPNSIGARFKSESYLFDEMFRYSRRWLNETTEWNGKPVDHKALADAFAKKWKEFKRTAKPAAKLKELALLKTR